MTIPTEININDFECFRMTNKIKMSRKEGMDVVVVNIVKYASKKCLDTNLIICLEQHVITTRQWRLDEAVPKVHKNL